MRVLLLDHNRICEFPELANRETPSELQTLKLHNNQIREIGASVADLVCLEELTLNNNQISNVQATILVQSKQLKRLSLYNNPLMNPPHTLLTQIDPEWNRKFRV